jgi:hypothetical protein
MPLPLEGGSGDGGRSWSCGRPGRPDRRREEFEPWEARAAGPTTVEAAAEYGMKEICPRGNNKFVILYFLIHDKGLLFML